MKVQNLGIKNPRDNISGRIGQGYTEISLRRVQAEPEFYCLAPEDNAIYDAMYQAYVRALESGETKEKARRFLPLGLYTYLYWYPNLVALYHFLDLRLAQDAQDEIRQYARVILYVLSEECPIIARLYKESRHIE